MAKTDRLAPARINRKQLYYHLASPKDGQAAIYHKLIKVAREGKPGREELYWYRSVESLIRRMEKGFQIPPLPSTLRDRARRAAAESKLDNQLSEMERVANSTR